MSYNYEQKQRIARETRQTEDIHICSMDAPKAWKGWRNCWLWLRRDSQLYISERHQIQIDDPLLFLHCKGEAIEAQQVTQGQGPHRSSPGVKPHSQRLILYHHCDFLIVQTAFLEFEPALNLTMLLAPRYKCIYAEGWSFLTVNVKCFRALDWSAFIGGGH